MSSNVISIATEFLRSNEPQHRKNALTALAVIRNKESITLIAETAIGDDDAEVRKRAQEEISILYEESSNTVLDVFEKALSENNDVKQQRAYAALGQLKSKGLTVPMMWLTGRAKLRLAARMHPHLYPARKFNFRLRSWWPALWGSLAGLLFLVWAVYRFLSSEGLGWGYMPRYIPFFLILTLAGIVLAVGATQRTTPINSHISRLAAIPFEILISTITGFLGMLVYFIILDTVLPDLQLKRSSTVFILVLLTGVLAGAVRGATIMAFGIYYNPKLNWMAEMLAGTLAGYLVIFLVIIISGRTADFNYPSEFLILSSFLLSLSCACAFAVIDSESPPVKGWPGVVGKVLRILLIPSLLILNFLMFILLIGNLPG